MPPTSVRFLTPEWVAALDEAAGGAPELRAASQGVELVVEQEVGGGGDEPVRYVFELSDGEVRFRWGGTPQADVTLVQNVETAEALSRGELNAQQAFVLGRLRVRGNVEKLLEARDALSRLETDVFAGVRNRTVYR